MIGRILTDRARVSSVLYRALFAAVRRGPGKCRGCGMEFRVRRAFSVASALIRPAQFIEGRFSRQSWFSSGSQSGTTIAVSGSVENMFPISVRSRLIRTVLAALAQPNDSMVREFGIVARAVRTTWSFFDGCLPSNLNCSGATRKHLANLCNHEYPKACGHNYCVAK